MRDAMPRVDIGILTFLDEEFEAVLDRFPTERIVEGRRLYNLSRVPLEGGEAYTVAVVRCLEMGGGEAGEVTRDLIEELSPSWLLVVGVAAALSHTLALGDVVVAPKIVSMERPALALAATGKKVPSTVFAHNDVVKHASNIQAHKSKLAGWNDVPLLDAEDLVSDDERSPRFVTGSVISINLLGKANLYLVGQNFHAQAVAIEAESDGIYRAASSRDVPTLSIRGIADINSSQRRPALTAYAARAAASFAHAFLRLRPVAPRKLAPPPPTSSEIPKITLDPARAFWVNRLRLSNVRGFGELEVTLALPDERSRGQWAILLGDNGVGKTSILRATALALSPDEVAHAVLSRMGAGSPTIRAKGASASIELGTPDGDLPRVVIRPSEGGERLEDRSRSEVPLPFVVGYGSRRGSALGGSARGIDFTPLAAVETLFDESTTLIHAETWLKEWKLAELQGGPDSKDASFFQAIIAALVDLLPDVEGIHVSRELVEVEGPVIGKVPLGALSDGYLTTMGWVLDMAARWVEHARRRGIPVGGDFREQMTGVAVIDEVDLHLHPRWQRDVLSTVRRLFPRMSFIVTTHNPLTLLGAQAGEIHVLRRDEQGTISIAQRDLPPGTDAERILTGEWFGLASTLDDETLRLLEDYRRKLREAPPDAPDVLGMEVELRRRLGSFADTSVEKLAHRAAAEVIDEDIRSLSPEQREAAHKKVADLLRGPVPARQKPKAKRARRSAG
jgi:nucleoside phosphorylase/energy-coupling factor transporter ATP-binding protein EcfA2